MYPDVVSESMHCVASVFATPKHLLVNRDSYELKFTVPVETQWFKELSVAPSIQRGCTVRSRGAIQTLKPSLGHEGCRQHPYRDE